MACSRGVCFVLYYVLLEGFVYMCRFVVCCACNLVFRCFAFSLWFRGVYAGLSNNDVIYCALICVVLL